MLSVDGRPPAVQEFTDRFEVSHLRPGLPRIVGTLYHEQAQQLVDLLPDGPSLTRALLRLWESKNEAVFLAVREVSA